MLVKVNLGNIEEVWDTSIEQTSVPKFKGKSKNVIFTENFNVKLLDFRTKNDILYSPFLKETTTKDHKNICLVNIDPLVALGEKDAIQCPHPVRDAIKQKFPFKMFIPVSFKFIRNKTFKILQSLYHYSLFSLNDEKFFIDHKDPYVVYKVLGDYDTISEILLYMLNSSCKSIRRVLIELDSDPKIDPEDIMNQFLNRYTTEELLLLSYFITDKNELSQVRKKVEALFSLRPTLALVNEATSSIQNSFNFRWREDKQNNFLSLLGSYKVEDPRHKQADKDVILDNLLDMYHEVPYSKEFSIGSKTYLADFMFRYKHKFYYQGSIWDKDMQVKESLLSSETLKELKFLDLLEVIDIESKS